MNIKETNYSKLNFPSKSATICWSLNIDVIWFVNLNFGCQAHSVKVCHPFVFDKNGIQFEQY